MKAKLAFSFGFPFRNPATFQNPAPNTYCEKKVNSNIFHTKLSREIVYFLYNMYTSIICVLCFSSNFGKRPSQLQRLAFAILRTWADEKLI